MTSAADRSPWHVGPFVDIAAYAFSWAFILVPLHFLVAPRHQVVMLLVVVGLTFAHRHYGLPYVYLDSEVFRTHPRRFTWFPLAAVVTFLLCPFLWDSPARLLVAAVVSFAGAWNVWHVYAQKFGILRMYAAKSGAGGATPRWADRLLLFCWVPLYVVWLGPTYRAQAEASFPTAKDFTLPLIDAAASMRDILAIPAGAIVVVGLSVFVAYEWKATRLRNAPRLWMALGTTLLSASFLVVHPVHAFMAFAFSHAVEYVVFVIAFQRRRYGSRLAHDPLLGRVLSRPVLAYVLFTVGITGPYLLARFWGYLIVPEAENPMFLGTTIERWAFYWSVLQSLVHFYYDGFLWKMRDPVLTAQL